ncbi:mis18-binding protein 1 isoform X1 [Fundulus heteroclitus]|uniref:mis18-binding protein 1 isoform X1 n=1 Tax=Fundulus heteroclitus TaxID=8078 RepID=UPI00165A7926|nr:mis18-binding protein 1 isoform X1 [Fundulus heteroclitus]
MASCGLLNRGDPCFLSPAKAFARLRSNVPKEPVCNVKERNGNGVRTRSKATAGRVCGAGGPAFNPNPAAFCRGGEQKENDRFASPEAKAQGPLRSPSAEETFGCLFSSTVLGHLGEQFPVGGSTRRHRAPTESASQPLRRLYTDPSTEDPGPLQANRKPRGDGAQNNTGRQDPGSVRGFPGVCLDPASMLSPAKMFAQMKERESLRGHQGSPTAGRRQLFARNESTWNLEECRDTDVSTIYSMERTVDLPVASTVKPVNQDQSELPERARGASEDILTPASPSPVAPLEDSLLLSTPHVSIPKKNKSVFRRNSSPKIKKFPSESVIHLRKWFLRRNNRGLFVDGIHVEKNVPWNSNIITERISRSALMTVSGRVYILVGGMKVKLATDFPMSFLKKFLRGFPLNWKTLYETFLTKDRQERKNNDTGRTRIQSVKTPDTSLPASCSFLNVTRSGRVIKPPLEYWKGGRVIVDAQMNVTVLQSYETPCPDLSTSLCPMTSEKAPPLFLPGSDGLSQHDSLPHEECSVPVRRVKADRKQIRAQANRYQKTANLTTETAKSPEEVSVKTRSSRRRQCLDVDPQKQGEPERPPSRRLKKTSSPTETVINLPQSPRRLRRGRAGHGTKGAAARNKSELEPNVSANQSPKALTKNRKEQKNNSRVAKKSVALSSSAAKPSSRTTQPGKRSRPKRGSASPPHQTDEDKWTKDEIQKLQTAVSCYPKHAAGYWAKVARFVGTRSAEECYKQHTSQGATLSPGKSTKNSRKVKKGEAAAAAAVKPAEVPVISARPGTLRRKQQVQQFLEALPREDMDDAFSSEYMKNKRMEIPSLCSSEDLDLALSDLEPQTPESSDFLEVKTPQCLHITPGMIGSPSTHTDNKYVFQLQKRMRKNRFDVCKTSSSSKKFKITPSVRRTVRRCINTAENDAFVIHEMVPENSSELYDSDEEEDFYFSDS